MSSLRAAILAAHEALDPRREAPIWPDPIASDGRRLEEQARELEIALASHVQAVDRMTAMKAVRLNPIEAEALERCKWELARLRWALEDVGDEAGDGVPARPPAAATDTQLSPVVVAPERLTAAYVEYWEDSPRVISGKQENLRRGQQVSETEEPGELPGAR